MGDRCDFHSDKRVPFLTSQHAFESDDDYDSTPSTRAGTLESSPTRSSLGGTDNLVGGSSYFSSKYLMGIACIVIVAILWTVDTVVRQIVFGELNFNHPFFFVFFSNSLYAFHLPILLGAKNCSSSQPPAASSLKETVRVGLMIAPLWLLGQWSYSYGVSLTTATVSTVISTTSCVWTYLFAIVFLKEQSSCGHFIGISFCVLGNILTCFQQYPGESESDSSSQQIIAPEDELFGKILLVFSSIVYAAYTTIISLKVQDEDYWQIGTLFASIGIGTFLLGLPIMFVGSQLFEGDVMGLDDFTGIVPVVMLLNGLVDNVLAQYLWCVGVLLTSSTVATVGLSLCIPLAMVADVFRGLDVGYWVVLASVCVIIGFVQMATISSQGSEQDQIQDYYDIEEQRSRRKRRKRRRRKEITIIQTTKIMIKEQEEEEEELGIQNIQKTKIMIEEDEEEISSGAYLASGPSEERAIVNHNFSDDRVI